MLHLCDDSEIRRFPTQAYGAAVDVCAEDEDGSLWIGNTEYYSQANYCPFCGYKAKVQIPWDGSKEQEVMSE